VARERAPRGVDLSVALFEIGRWARRSSSKIDRAASDTLLKTIRQSDLPFGGAAAIRRVLPGLSGDAARTSRNACARLRRKRGLPLPEVTKLEGDESFGDVVSRARARARLARGGAPNRIVDMS
jgi:hypothetical protein